jgi:hypothetical protein
MNWYFAGLMTYIALAATVLQWHTEVTFRIRSVQRDLIRATTGVHYVGTFMLRVMTAEEYERALSKARKDLAFERALAESAADHCARWYGR